MLRSQRPLSSQRMYPERHDTMTPTPLLPLCDGVIFDCDGVLVDSERISNGVWARLLTEAGLPMTTEQSLGIFLGNSMATCVALATDMLGHALPDDLLDRFHAITTIELERDLVAVNGVFSLLDALDATGVRYAVASNGEHEKMAITLGKTGLASRFDGRRFSSLDVGKPKPAPDLFLYTAAKMGFTPSRTIVVEDSPLGVMGASAAGMSVIGYAELVAAERLRSAGATVTVERLLDVAPLIGISIPAS